MSLVIRQARVRAVGWFGLAMLLVACTRGGSPTGTAPLAPTATATRSAPPTTIATGGPRPSVATPTSPATPATATSARATPTLPVTPATSPPATPGRGTATPPGPLGVVPAGWHIYQGPLPFAIAYPPDWTVDESQLSNNLVYFFAPGADQSVFVVIATTAAPQASPNLDVLRDDWFQSRTRGCKQFAVEETGATMASGINFATVGATCDLPTGLAYSYTGLGLRGTVPWIFEFDAPYDDFTAWQADVFDHMLATLNIYGGFTNR
jgi:hypothetical protein